MGQYTMTPILGDRSLLDAIKAVAADERSTMGLIVRDAVDKVYGPRIAEKLEKFAANGNLSDQSETPVIEEAEHVA